MTQRSLVWASRRGSCRLREAGLWTNRNGDVGRLLLQEHVVRHIRRPHDRAGPVAGARKLTTLGIDAQDRSDARQHAGPASLDAIKADDPEKARLSGRGWHIVDPHRVARTPSAYRRYMATALAEFTAVKGVDVSWRTGWLSDLAAAFLAA